MLCVNYGISNLDFVMYVESELNPTAGISIAGCDSPQDCSVCFSDCQSDWVWLYRYTLMLTEISFGTINIVQPTSGSLIATECIEGNPEIPLVVLGYFGVNQDCLTEPQSTEISSWGVIKGLYSE